MLRVLTHLTMLLTCCTALAGTARPNILFIAVDDLRPELKCYGAEHMVTPRMDRLASQGVIFTRAYCQVPVCGASRASLLSGLRPTRSRFLSYTARADEQAPGAVTLPGHFRSNGYQTISVGKVFHHHRDSADSWSEPPWRAYDENGRSKNVYLEPENVELYYAKGEKGPAYESADVPDSEYYDGITVERSVEYLKQLKDSDRPFFLAVGLIKPHLPFCAPKKYWDLYPPETIRLPDNYFAPTNAPRASLHNWGELRGYRGIPRQGPLPDELARTLIRGYYASTSYSDALVGRLLDELDHLGLRDNTIVVLWGDHGWNLGEHTLWCKHCNYDTSLRVPLMFSVPGGLKGAKSASLAEFVDVYPTLCELAGLQLPGHLDGTSLVPVLNDPKHVLKDAVYSRFKSGESVRTDRWLYTEYYQDTARTRLKGRMLYDHQADPDENMNVVDLPEHRGRVEKMSQALSSMRANGKM